MDPLPKSVLTYHGDVARTGGFVVPGLTWERAGALHLDTTLTAASRFSAEVNLDHRVTNVYRREAGTWKIVHHHTDLSPAMIDLVGSLQAKK